MTRQRSFLFAALVGSLFAAGPAAAQMRSYDTKYYVLRTDLDADAVRAVVQRITAMAEEFHYRTRGFSGAVQRRLPFYVFRETEDYVAAGGMPGSAGVFTGNKLMAVAGQRISDSTWHVIQHEAFHQFAHAAFRNPLPTWVDEGLAEYFGFGRFTGDDFAVGLVPPARLAWLKRLIREESARPLIEMMRLHREIWNTEVGMAHEQAGANYLQAWSMVHFLAHADNGRYQSHFTRWLDALNRGQDWKQAWRQVFGNDVSAFERRWRRYWLEYSEDDARQPYVEATVATVTSFYARALAERQRFDSFDEFRAAALADKLRMSEEQWLPLSLLTDALRRGEDFGEWSIRRRGKPAVICALADGARVEGRYRLSGRKVKSVEVLVKKPRGRRP